MKLFSLLILSLSFSQFALSQSKSITSVEVTVFDAEFESNCVPKEDSGCIRMQVVLNNDQKNSYIWVTDIGRAELSHTGEIIERKNTPNFSGNSFGTLRKASYMSAKDRYALPYFSHIKSSNSDNDTPWGVYGRNDIIGERVSLGAIAINLDNMARLHEWLTEAKENNGSTSITITAPTLSKAQVIEISKKRNEEYTSVKDGAEYSIVLGLSAMSMMGISPKSYRYKEYSPDLGKVSCKHFPDNGSAWSPKWVLDVLNRANLKSKNLCIIPLRNS